MQIKRFYTKVQSLRICEYVRYKYPSPRLSDNQLDFNILNPIWLK